MPAVEERPAGSFKLFVERGTFPFHDGEFMNAIAFAAEQAHIGLEGVRPADDACGGRVVAVDGRGVCLPVKDEKGVRKAAKIDPCTLSKFDPIAVGMHARGRGREMVTPVTLIACRQKSAVGLVCAGRDNTKERSEVVSMALQRTRDRMSSRLYPENSMRLRNACEEGDLRLGRQLVQDVTDDEQIAERFRLWGFLDRKTGECFPRLVCGEAAGER